MNRPIECVVEGSYPVGYRGSSGEVAREGGVSDVHPAYQGAPTVHPEEGVGEGVQCDGDGGGGALGGVDGRTVLAIHAN